MSNAKGMRPSAVESTASYTVTLYYDVNNNPEYKAKADIGTATSASGWQIQKFIYDVNQNLIDIQWADGDDAFDKIADNYATYSYS